MDWFQLPWARVAETITEFIRDQMRGAGRERGIIGLSGGLDSTVSAFAAAAALGPDNLIGFMLPYDTSSEQSRRDALMAAKVLGIRHEHIDITPQIDAYFEHFPEANRLRRANKMARERMSVLYDQSERFHALVVGTGNRTEALLGYTTLWGDMACAFNPVGDLYKTQVRQFACHLGVPTEIIAKPPSADLWQGQTDEGELGFSYDEADGILHRLVDRRLTAEQVIAEGFSASVVDRVVTQMERSAFKRRMPPCPELRGLAV